MRKELENSRTQGLKKPKQSAGAGTYWRLALLLDFLSA